MLVEFAEDLQNIRVNISNNGYSIPKEIIDNIFKEGFTTKGDKGDGIDNTQFFRSHKSYNYKSMINHKNLSIWKMYLCG
jgi:sensor histidine kinase regulating citrate/malate metabolism